VSTAFYFDFLLEGADAFDALLAADARRLHSAEGSTQVEARGAVIVDPDITADALAGDSIGCLGLGCPDRARIGPL
jgi:hypothetical protein